MEYTIIYSNRKTLSLTVKDASVIVRSPYGLGRSVIESFVKSHEKWIYEKLEIQRKRKEKFSEISPTDVARLKVEAKKYFEEKTRAYSDIMGLKYGRIKITSAKTRFGSCNSNGTVCFSYRLMLYPEAAREYVIVHELSHLVYMNHSRDFYKLVEQYMPDYKERKRLLK